MEPPVCSQLCDSTTPDGYQCSCVNGYQLALDRHRCVVESSSWKMWKYSTALVFYTQSGRVMSTNVKSGGKNELVYRGTGLVSALGLLANYFPSDLQFLALKR